jgi:hypothetical protein
MRTARPIDGLPYDRAGSDIDTTNPEAAKWYWKTLREDIISQGFDSLWADETEPDLPPNGAYFHIGPGTQFFNVYPLLHTAALYDGFRKDEPGRRALTLSRDAYLGAQRNGTIFWSSDIDPTWDTFRRQIPTGLDFAASGMTYWSNDTGGWQYLPACTIRRTRRCLTPPMPAPPWAATTTIRSSTPAGSSTPASCPSSAHTAAVPPTRCGPTAVRPSRFWRSTCACATS